MRVDEQLPVINPVLWGDLENRDAAEIFAGNPDLQRFCSFFCNFDRPLLLGVVKIPPAFKIIRTRARGGLGRIGESLEDLPPSL